jgi:beta-lactamase superfamily II metal-dependent hydrolase
MKKIVALTLLLISFLPFQSIDASPLLKVHFIDVGQGDSILIETPTDLTILIDGGEPKEGRKLVRYLKKHDIEEIDFMIATHPDFDHIGGLLDVLRQFPVHHVIDNGELHPTRTYAMYRLLLFMNDIPVKVAEKNDKWIMSEDLTLHVLHAATNQAESTNQSSIALKLSYRDVDFLFMGDVEAKNEEKIAAAYNVDTEVLKVAHHGSDSSSSRVFLEEANPEVSIITYGEANDYGHPVSQVIQNLTRIESQIYSTAGYGDILIESDGEDYIVIPSMQPMERLLQRMGK